MIARVWFTFVVLAALGAAACAQNVTLIPRGSVWKYLDDGSDQGSAWQQPGFDDTAWAAGAAELGYGDNGGEATVVNYIDTDPVTAGDQRNITTYFRHSFSVPDPSAFTGLLLRILRDDGAVIYLNGTEVARTNMPSGAVTYTLPAASALNPPLESDWQAIALPTAGLVAGANVVAVEVHQHTAESSDMSFDLEFVAATGTPAVFVARGPYLQRAAPSQITVRWRTDVATDTHVLYGTSPAALTQSQSKATVETEHNITLTGLEPATTYYYAIGTSTQVLAGGENEQQFATPPIGGTVQRTTVWVIGDSGTGGDGRGRAERVRDAFYAHAAGQLPDVWLMLGDNAYNDGLDSEYQKAVFDTYPTLLRKRPYWSTLGNHDTNQDSSPSTTLPYFAIHSLPRNAEAGGIASGSESYYSFDHAHIHFICLDAMTTTSRQPGSAMLTWLQNDLLATTQPWVIAFWHHPPYTKGTHDSDSETALVQMRTNVLPLLEAGGVDLVLSGHSHVYERSCLLNGHYGLSGTLENTMKIDPGNGRELGDGAYTKASPSPTGAVYTVCGSSGKIGAWDNGSTTLINPAPHPAMVVSRRELGSLILEIDGDRLDGRFLNDAGAVTDTFTLTKTPLLNAVSTAPAAELGLVPGAITITRSGGEDESIDVTASIGGSATPGVDYGAIAVPFTIPAGARSITVPILPLGDSIAEGTESVSLTLPAAPTGYALGRAPTAVTTITDIPMDAWRVAKFGIDANDALVSGDDRDPDDDGVSNLLEYGFAMEPLIPSTDGLPSATAGPGLGIIFRRDTRALDLTYTVQAAAFIEEPWTDGSTYSAAGDVPITAATKEVSRTGTGVEQIVVEDQVGMDAAEKRFLRVKLQKN